MAEGTRSKCVRNDPGLEKCVGERVPAPNKGRKTFQAEDSKQERLILENLLNFPPRQEVSRSAGDLEFIGVDFKTMATN